MRLRHVPDVGRVREGIGVGHQRERTDVARVMTSLAIRLEDPNDFVAERRSAYGRGGMHSALTGTDEGQDQGGCQDSAAHGVAMITPLIRF
jgi:hypothetical protein